MIQLADYTFSRTSSPQNGYLLGYSIARQDIYITLCGGSKFCFGRGWRHVRVGRTGRTELVAPTLVCALQTTLWLLTKIERQQDRCANYIRRSVDLLGVP